MTMPQERHPLYHKPYVHKDWRMQSHEYILFTSDKKDRVFTFRTLPNYERRTFEKPGSTLVCEFTANRADMINAHKAIVRDMICRKVMPQMLENASSLTHKKIKNILCYAGNDESKNLMWLLKRSLEMFSPQGLAVEMETTKPGYPALNVRLY